MVMSLFVRRVSRLLAVPVSLVGLLSILAMAIVPFRVVTLYFLSNVASLAHSCSVYISGCVRNLRLTIVRLLTLLRWSVIERPLLNSVVVLVLSHGFPPPEIFGQRSCLNRCSPWEN